eukprot:5525519-Prymnesium_polylepis.1
MRSPPVWHTCICLRLRCHLTYPQVARECVGRVWVSDGVGVLRRPNIIKSVGDRDTRMLHVSAACGLVRCMDRERQRKRHTGDYLPD